MSGPLQDITVVDLSRALVRRPVDTIDLGCHPDKNMNPDLDLAVGRIRESGNWARMT